MPALVGHLASAKGQVFAVAPVLAKLMSHAYALAA